MQKYIEFHIFSIFYRKYVLLLFNIIKYICDLICDKVNVFYYELNYIISEKGKNLNT